MATFAVPVRRRDTLLGALNVFVPSTPDRASGVGSSEVLMAQALADAAALGLENQRAYTRCRSLAGQLQEALSSRVRIEQAKGMLAERWRVVRAGRGEGPVQGSRWLGAGSGGSTVTSAYDTEQLVRDERSFTL